MYERRQEVIDYVSRKYGPDHVSQIITFGTMSARMVIRDVGRVLDVPYATADKLAKMVPNELHITIKKALEQNKEFKDEYENNPETKKLLDIAMALKECQDRLQQACLWYSYYKRPSCNLCSTICKRRNDFDTIYNDNS